MAIKFENAEIKVCKIYDGNIQIETLCVVFDRTTGTDSKKKRERDVTFPLLDHKRNILPEGISIARLCKFTDEEINRRIDKFLSEDKEKPKTILGLIETATSLEELANIWKYVDKKGEKLTNGKDYYIKLIKEKLPYVTFLNPLFFKEKFTINSNDDYSSTIEEIFESIEIEKKERLKNEDKFQFYTYKILCLYELYKFYKIQGLRKTIDCKGSEIEIEMYLKIIIEKGLDILLDFTAVGITDINTAKIFIKKIANLDFFANQTFIQYHLCSLADHYHIYSPKIRILEQYYKNKLSNIKNEIENQHDNISEEAINALEKNSPLHYSFAYHSIYRGSKKSEKYWEYKLKEVKAELKKKAFNEREFALLNNIVYNAEPDTNINLIIFALVTSLDNETLNIEQVNLYHRFFYDTLAYIHEIESLTSDSIKNIQQLFEKYCYIYDSETYLSYKNSFKKVFIENPKRT